MKCLITGHRGFIGRHLYTKVVEMGWEVEGIDLKEGKDIITYEFSGEYDVIFHLAANASIPASFEKPLESHMNNVYGSLRVLDFAKKIGAKIIFSSSSSVYGEPQTFPTCETDAISYMSPYAFQKYEIEEYLKLLKIPHICLRYFNVFGEGQENANAGDNSLMLATFLKQKREGLPLTIVGTGEQKRDFIYVKDVVDANILAAGLNIREFNVFNVGSGKNYSVNQIANIIDPTGIRQYLPARTEPFMGLSDISRIKHVFGWKPTINIEEWLNNKND